MRPIWYAVCTFDLCFRHATICLSLAAGLVRYRAISTQHPLPGYSLSYKYEYCGIGASIWSVSGQFVYEIHLRSESRSAYDREHREAKIDAKECVFCNGTANRMCVIESATFYGCRELCVSSETNANRSLNTILLLIIIKSPARCWIIYAPKRFNGAIFLQSFKN